MHYALIIGRNSFAKSVGDLRCVNMESEKTGVKVAEDQAFAIMVKINNCVRNAEDKHFVFTENIKYCAKSVEDQHCAFMKKLKPTVGSAVGQNFVFTSNTVKNAKDQHYVPTTSVKFIAYNVMDPKFALIKKKRLMQGMQRIRNLCSWKDKILVQRMWWIVILLAR